MTACGINEREPKDRDLEDLPVDLESDRVERKNSISDRDRVGEGNCAFANDLPIHNCPGVLFVGDRDNGFCADLNAKGSSTMVS